MTTDVKQDNGWVQVGNVNINVDMILEMYIVSD
jgi:hypothetical protein